MTTPNPSPVDPTSPRHTNEPPKGSGMMTALVGLGALLIVGGAIAATIAFSGPKKPPNPKDGPTDDPNAIAAGQQVAARTCFTCHSVDGSRNRGPTWKGLYGSVVTYDDGSTGIIDEAAVREALVHPTAKIIEGYEGIMPPAPLPEQDIKNLLAYMRSLK